MPVRTESQVQLQRLAQASGQLAHNQCRSLPQPRRQVNQVFSNSLRQARTGARQLLRAFE